MAFYREGPANVKRTSDEVKWVAWMLFQPVRCGIAAGRRYEDLQPQALFETPKIVVRLTNGGRSSSKTRGVLCALRARVRFFFCVGSGKDFTTGIRENAE